MRLTFLSPDKEHHLWQNLLSGMDKYDSYHTADYSALSEKKDKPYLIFWEKGDAKIGIPVVEREIPSTRGWKDLTSVYGYPGPVVSRQVTQQHFDLFVKDLQQWMYQNNIVSLFSRLHPFERKAREWIPCDQLFLSNKTVYLPIANSPLVDSFDQNHRRDIKTLIRQGFEPEISPLQADSFQEIYLQTMVRKQASLSYCFDGSYFQQLLNAKDFDSILITISKEERVIAGGIFLFCQEVAQYHLGAVRDGFQNCPLLKLILLKAAETAQERGMKTLHLGGGYNGSDKDGLFDFKSKFSRHHAHFYTWRWIVDPEKYRILSQDKEATSYFPLYRS